MLTCDSMTIMVADDLGCLRDVRQRKWTTPIGMGLDADRRVGTAETGDRAFAAVSTWHEPRAAMWKATGTKLPATTGESVFSTLWFDDDLDGKIKKEQEPGPSEARRRGTPLL